MSREVLVDYHVHLLGHVETKTPPAGPGDFIEAARRRGLSEIGFADHDYCLDAFDLASLDRAKADYPSIRIRRGLEVDFVPGIANWIREKLQGLDLDYAIGSVHTLDGWGFDDPAEMAGWARCSVEEVYRAYYAAISRAASSRLFDIIGHLDLPKVLGYRPSGDPAALAQGAVRAIRDAGSAVEINTSGIRKLAREMYPSRQILDMCFAAGIPVTLGSDAHVPADVGRDLDAAQALAKQAGYTKVVTYDKRKRFLLSL